MNSLTDSSTALCESWLTQKSSSRRATTHSQFIFTLLRSLTPSNHAILGLPLDLFTIGFQSLILLRLVILFSVNSRNNLLTHNILSSLNVQFNNCFNSTGPIRLLVRTKGSLESFLKKLVFTIKSVFPPPQDLCTH